MAYPPRQLTGGVIINDVNVNASSTNSEILNIERAKHVGIDLFINNNNLVGNVEVEVCNDLTVASPNWVPIELSTGSTRVAITSGTNNNEFFDLTDVAAKYMQVAITRDSGDGVVRAVAHVKAA